MLSNWVLMWNKWKLPRFDLRSRVSNTHKNRVCLFCFDASVKLVHLFFANINYEKRWVFQAWFLSLVQMISPDSLDKIHWKCGKCQTCIFTASLKQRLKNTQNSSFSSCLRPAEPVVLAPWKFFSTHANSSINKTFRLIWKLNTRKNGEI